MNCLLKTHGPIVRSLAQALRNKQSKLIIASKVLRPTLTLQSKLDVSTRYFSLNVAKFNIQHAKPIIKASTNEDEVKEIHIDKTKRESYGLQDKSFSDYNLPEALINSLNSLGYDKPFPIQEATLKHTLEGRDLIGRAITGSGKTLAFGIPIINKVLNSPNRAQRSPKCLVLSPTRELCQQLQAAIQSLSKDVKCVAIYGGANMESQIRQLNTRADVVCATPGRLKDLMRRKNFNPEFLELICLDEADELLRPSFLEDIQDVLQAAQSKQILMFSATINDDVKDVINEYMKDPVKIDLTQGQKLKVPENVKQYEIVANQKTYPDIVAQLIKQYKSERCIVFVNRKTIASEISNELYDEHEIRSRDLHSDHNQAKRERIFKDFKAGRFHVLVATDVAARGLDVPEIDLIIHVGLPPNGVDYFIHRSGRTGRAGRSGVSVVLHSNSAMDRGVLKDIKRVVKLQTLAVPPEVKEKYGDKVLPNDDGDYNDRRQSRMSNYGDRRRSFSNEREYRNMENVYSGKVNNRSYQFRDNDNFRPRSKSAYSTDRRTSYKADYNDFNK